ncbi:unnamed protein product [Didymodactylos carnosus]|uniref:Uncharacterized protein n=1 Tax=Didymodactylos carnosus TaxID=1234261 RepID=A0A8S2F0P8_9BILA|nr:unnamed protein product [Didymodactylos carnosus]CAF4095502.1 unnamed protein product [Didymodactylos carnosus]
MNGTVPRLTVNVQNVIVRLQGFLPDVIMENVIIVLTNAYRYAANADLEKLLNLKSIVHPFYMQNSAFSNSKWDQMALESLQADWKMSMTELKTLVDLVDQFEVKTVAAFGDMKQLRHDIKSMMHNARLEVENIQKAQDEMAAIQTGIKGFDDDISKNKDFTRKKVDVAQLVDAPYHSTICSQCNHVCHDHCALQETYTQGHQVLCGCSCMGGANQCRVCEGHCPYTQHYHARKTMSKTQQTVDEVLHDIKAKYDAASTNKNQAQQKLTTISDQKKMLENALIQKNAEIKTKCLELKKHCSGFNIVAELNIMIKQLETSKHNIKDLDALRQAETFINSLVGFCNQLEKDTALPNTQQKNQMKIQDNYRPGPRGGGTNFQGQRAVSGDRAHNDEQYSEEEKEETGFGNAPLQNQQRPRRKKVFNRHPDSATSNQDNFIRNAPRQQHQQQQQRPNRAASNHRNYNINTPCQQQQPLATGRPAASSDGKNIWCGGFTEGTLNHRDLENYFAKYVNYARPEKQKAQQKHGQSNN